jgi:hypothetical protein
MIDISLILVTSFVLFNISSKFILYLECYHPKCTRMWVNRLNRPKNISVSLRRVIRLSQWFIMVCFWLNYTKKYQYFKINILKINLHSLYHWLIAFMGTYLVALDLLLTFLSSFFLSETVVLGSISSNGFDKI